MIITFISDTHSKHNKITQDLPGGDLLIHAGDISSRGYQQEIKNFVNWFNGLDNYTNKIFIAGNHDFGFQDEPYQCEDILKIHDKIVYLQDNLKVIDGKIKVWGSPWQPEFHNWAFNLQRNGEELKSKWDMVPNDTDIIITHGPAWGYVDKIKGQTQSLGCELLTEKIKQIKPKIHLCGHIHSGRGYVFDGNTHFINASVLDERYEYTQKPLTAEWFPETNDLEFL